MPRLNILNYIKQRRAAKSLNPILKQLKLTTDAEFIALCIRLHSRIPEAQLSSADELMPFLVRTFKGELHPERLSLKTLNALLPQCDGSWFPKTSHRLIISGTIPKVELQLNDTVILPDGVCQVKLDEKKEPYLELIIDAAEMTQMQLGALIPNASAAYEEIDYSLIASPYHALVATLNKHIVNKKTGVWLANEYGDVGYQIAGGIGALRTCIEEEIQARAKKMTAKKNTHPNTFFFSRHAKIKPATPHKQPDNIKTAEQSTASLPTSSQPHSAQSVAPIKISKTPQAEDTRPLAVIETTMQGVVQQLNTILAMPNKQSLYQQRTTDHGQTIEVYQQANTGTHIVMAASSDTVTIFAPLIQDRKLAPSDKAALFLKALGMPPLNGRDTLDIEGASPKLHSAIIRCFETLKAQEAAEKNHSPHRTRQ